VPAVRQASRDAPCDGALAHAESNRAKRWTDLLMGPDLVMVARTVSDLQDERAKGFIAHSLQIHKIDSPKLQKPPPPQHFLIELIGRVDIAGNGTMKVRAVFARYAANGRRVRAANIPGAAKCTFPCWKPGTARTCCSTVI